MQKKILLLILFASAIFLNPSIAQKTRNVFWFMPSKAQKVNGVCFTLLPSDFVQDSGLVVINGLSISTDILNVMALSIGTVHLLFDKNAHKYVFLTYAEKEEKKSDYIINGVNIGTGLLGDVDINGVNIQALYILTGKIRGVSINPIMTKIYDYKSLIISGLYNKTTEGQGVQIGLINDCKNCQGVQIGLINKMGNRTVPFINFRFKKPKQSHIPNFLPMIK
jgi:hypothetical protein